VVLTALLAVPCVAGAQIPVFDCPRFEMKEVADDVYAFAFDNPLGPAVDPQPWSSSPTKTWWWSTHRTRR